MADKGEVDAVEEEDEEESQPSPVHSWVERILMPKVAPQTQRPVPTKTNIRKLMFQREPKKKNERPKREGPNVLIDILKGR